MNPEYKQHVLDFLAHVVESEQTIKRLTERVEYLTCQLDHTTTRLSNVEKSKQPLEHIQKLIDICFEVGLTVNNYEAFKSLNNDQLAGWIASQLESCGYKTVPIGASYGVYEE